MNIVTTIQILQEVCGSLKEMNKICTMGTLLMLLYGSSSFKYTSSFMGESTAVGGNRVFNRPFQERRAIARARAHTRAKVFRRVINCTRK